MSARQVISTDKAPVAIGAYSQAVRHQQTLFVSGQIPLDPTSGEVVAGDARTQIDQTFKNLKAIVEAADASLDDVVKLTVYLTDLGEFPIVNEVMAEYFEQPYPARAAIGIASLPKGVGVEVEAIVALKE